MMAKYMQVVWLYIIGILIIFFGLYIMMTDSGPMSFMVMLMGLAVAAIGAAHGRKMRTMGQADVENMMQGHGFPQEEPEKPKAEDFAEKPEEQEQPPDEVKEGPHEAPPNGSFAPKQGPQLGEKLTGVMGMFRKRSPQEPLSQEEIIQLEMQDMKEGRIVPAQADVIELVCPKCGSENESQNLFCFSCGNRLRRMTDGEEDSGKINLRIEPGAIDVVEDQRVAKVVICPKCNVANKVNDKFCWNCGKKIKSDSKETMEELKNIIEQTASAPPKKPRKKTVKKAKKKTEKPEPDFDDIFGKGKKKAKPKKN